MATAQSQKTHSLQIQFYNFFNKIWSTLYMIRIFNLNKSEKMNNLTGESMDYIEVKFCKEMLVAKEIWESPFP